MGGPSVPGIGFAMVVELFLMEAESQGVVLSEREPVKLCLVHMSDASYQRFFNLHIDCAGQAFSCEV